MNPWVKHPLIYEINTWVWLDELSRKYQRKISLANTPTHEWEAIAAAGFDAVWLMGVWERSPAGIAIANRNAGLVAEFKSVLPDFAPPDNVGSPYCVRRYSVAEHLGGAPGLAAARHMLSRRGIRLILDFVPNHVAPDHPWTSDHPEYFIEGHADDVRRDQASFVEVAGRVLACGRDPCFPAWPDVVQVNAFAPELRRAAIATLSEIAAQCDGVRCDMAMLMINDVFARTWGTRAGTPPDDEYWTTVIAAVRDRHPDFRFIAEAYWGREWELQQQGFDFCYDKTLYDRLAHGDAENVRRHLLADTAYQQKMLRFIENHDEPRAATAFAAPQGQSAALTTLTLSGAKLVHEGQIEGRQVRLPVFLAHRPSEPVNRECAAFYERLFAAIDRDVFRSGTWRLCERHGWPDNQSHLAILAWTWTLGAARVLVVINDGAKRAQARVRLPWTDLDECSWRLDDLLSGASYERSGKELNEAGLYVDLAPWKYHLLEFCAE